MVSFSKPNDFLLKPMLMALKPMLMFKAKPHFRMMSAVLKPHMMVFVPHTMMVSMEPTVGKVGADKEHATIDDRRGHIHRDRSFLDDVWW